MHRVLSAITSLLFVGHVAFGCCGHHVHDDHGPIAAGLAVGGERACDAGHDHDGHEQPADDEHQGGCCHLGRCIFVKSQVTHVDHAIGPATWLPVTTTAAGQLNSVGAAAARDMRDESVAHQQPLHVLHCALLI